MTTFLIYSCIFFNETFIDLYSLLLKSYILFGNTNDNIDYLIICNPELKDKIQKMFDTLHINGKIWCVKLKSIFEIGCSKLQIFNYPHINSYHKILYLNYNVLITDSINNILDLPLDNKLYAPQEGNTNHDLWGKEFFNNNPNCSAFTTDILLFNNNTIINKLFSQILMHIYSHIKNNSSITYLLDQPFIVYHAIKENIYDNQKLTNLVTNNPNHFNGQTIFHFQGRPNDYKNIIIKMDYFMKNILFNLNINNKIIPEIIPYKFIDKLLLEGTNMVSKEKLVHLYKQCNKFKNTNYSFVECGLSKCSCIELMKYVAGDNNKIFEFDCLEEISVMQENICKLKDIAILRLNGDWCKSVKVCLDTLYNKVIERGIIIIHDYKRFIDAKNAIDAFRQENNIKSPFIHTDHNEVYWVKESSFHINKDFTDIYDDVWTCSHEFRDDIKAFFKDKSHYKIAEIGSHKGYTTRYLSDIFKTVYAVDNSIEWTNFNKDLNKDKKNIEYIHLDIYEDSWNIIPEVDVVFIDAVHSYDGCKSDIYNSIKTFNSVKYIIFDDYGVWPGVKQIVNECLTNEMLIFKKYIGLNDVPGPGNNVVKNTTEGMICGVNINNKIITNKKYKWENSTIIFLENGHMDAFGSGKYNFMDKYLVKCDFGNREHLLKFNKDYSQFISVRKDDFEVVVGNHL